MVTVFSNEQNEDSRGGEEGLIMKGQGVVLHEKQWSIAVYVLA